MTIIEDEDTSKNIQSIKELFLGPDMPLRWYQKGAGVAAFAFFVSFIVSMFLILLGIIPLTWTSEGIIGIFFLLGFLFLAFAQLLVHFL